MANSEEFEFLAKSILKVRNKQESENFLRDLFSASELESIAGRLNAALLLHQGSSYVDIERKTGMSSATIAKVSEALKYGNDGFKLVLDRLTKTRN